jgi:transposase
VAGQPRNAFCIAPRRNRKTPSPFSKASYRKRHLVENFFERIKNFRRVATGCVYQNQ